MKTERQKSVFWALLATGVGGLLLFALVAITEGVRTTALYWFPGCGLAATMLSINRLRALYRLEPSHPLGLWQISLSDLLASVCLAGLVFGVLQWALGELFLRLGIPYSIVSSALLPIGMLVASRKRISGWIVRPLFALGFSLKVVGAIVSGALFALIAFIMALEGRRALNAFTDLLDFSRVDWPIMMFRIGFIFLVIGMICCRMALLFSPPAGPSRAETPGKETTDQMH